METAQKKNMNLTYCINGGNYINFPNIHTNGLGRVILMSGILSPPATLPSFGGNMSLQSKAQKTWDDLPPEYRQKAVDDFIKLLEEDNCVIIDRRGLVVDWEMKPEHPFLQKLHPGLTDISQLDRKQQKKYNARKKGMSNRLQAKCQRQAVKDYINKVKVTLNSIGMDTPDIEKLSTEEGRAEFKKQLEEKMKQAGIERRES